MLVFCLLVLSCCFLTSYPLLIISSLLSACRSRRNCVKTIFTLWSKNDCKHSTLVSWANKANTPVIGLTWGWITFTYLLHFAWCDTVKRNVTSVPFIPNKNINNDH